MSIKINIETLLPNTSVKFQQTANGSIVFDYRVSGSYDIGGKNTKLRDRSNPITFKITVLNTASNQELFVLAEEFSFADVENCITIRDLRTDFHTPITAANFTLTKNDKAIVNEPDPYASSNILLDNKINQEQRQADYKQFEEAAQEIHIQIKNNTEQLKLISAAEAKYAATSGYGSVSASGSASIGSRLKSWLQWVVPTEIV